MDTIEAIERATLAAVPPQQQQEWEGWLLPLDHGTVGRCRSAVPLRHDAPRPGSVQEIERRYAAAGLQPVLRLPDVPAFEALRAQLTGRGYARAKPTLVQVGTVDGLAGGSDAKYDLVVTSELSEEWAQVFLGGDLDAADAASRLAILRRGTQSVFASVREDGRTVAVGSACFSGGWCGVHGMRTLAAHRGRGLASAVLRALGGAARARGIAQTFLQVDAANAQARSLYAGFGFRTAWSYSYWKRA